MNFGNLLHDFILADNFVAQPMTFSIKRHELNETHFNALGSPKFGEIKNLIVVDSTFNDCVDLDARETGTNRRINACQHTRQFVAASHLFKLCSVKRVKTDVDATDPGQLQFINTIRQCRTVSRDRQVDRLTSKRRRRIFWHRQRRKLGDQNWQVGTHRGLSTR